MKKTILTTVGAGFIGSNLCEALLKQANKAVCGGGTKSGIL